MNANIEYNAARSIMGENFVGVEELKKIDGLELDIPDDLPEIPFGKDELKEKRDEYLLILALDRFADGRIVNIKNMIRIFGKNPDVSEPCFYNQDWYDKEDFIIKPIQTGWFLIRKTVYEDSRAVQPIELIERYTFPTAVKCTYSFFIAWITLDIKLWYHDFVWCSDIDHNGDRIYVGKYNDVDGVNKNGFSIHRHLALRACYGCID